MAGKILQVMDAHTGTTALLVSSIIIGVTHTLLGPDHYLPFVALGKARKWTLRWTLGVTFLCGLGHVGASVLIGVIAAAAGWSLGSVNAFESFRGEIAAWLLIFFGLFYLVWALRRLAKGKTHTHVHVHADGTCHEHPHPHTGEHTHVHTADGSGKRLTAWSLFIIFVFGPCEALIPLLLFPALAHDRSLAVAVVALFACATILTMMTTVWAMTKGMQLIKIGSFGRYGHVAASAVILSCGTAIHLGL